MNQTIITSLIFGIPGILFLLVTFYVFSLRRIVPTNVVHIVQRGKETTSYGTGKVSNVYYEFPGWLPVIGVKQRTLPVSNFDIDLIKYSAYDKDRLPFNVDVKAFFHIADTNKAAEKVESFEELRHQLEDVVKGAVRSILAKFTLDEIMEKRSVFGDEFTESVNGDLKNWGVESIKNIELMDVRDAEGSTVIHQVMAKKMSVIDMESRTEIAINRKKAEQAELEAQKEVSITKAQTQQLAGEAQAQSAQAIGIATAESEKQRGIAQQTSASEIAKAQRLTSEQEMEVLKVREVKRAEIDKETSIIVAEQEKQQMEISANANRVRVEIDANAEKSRIEIGANANKSKVEIQATADLEAKKRDAEGIRSLGEANAHITKLKGSAEAEVTKLKGGSEAEAKKLMELAGVTAQTTLAEKIGDNKGYQDYLIRVKEVEVSQVIGISQYESLGKALATADLKLLINSGDVHSGIGKLSDLFTSKGGSQVVGLMEALKQTDEGKAILGMIDQFKNKS